jgi:imidazolonepropionase-like amidohydrolase
MKKWLLVFFIIIGSQIFYSQNLLLRNGTVYTFDRGILDGYDILILKGKIAKIGKNISGKGNINTINIKGKSVIPGIIDSHNHIGLLGGINEFSENITPEVKMEHQIFPDDLKIYYCLTGGTTMAHSMHGSANPIGGQNVVIKLKWGKSAEEMWEKRASRSLKMALGENPKVSNYQKYFPATRMGISYAIEKSFVDAIAYKKKWAAYRAALKNSKKKARSKIIPPKRDFRLETLIETLEKKLVVRCHSYRAEESLELIRLSKKYGFTIAAFEHLHQAYRIADQLSENNIGISIFADVWNYKTEASEFTPLGLKILHEKGVNISLNSDGSEIMRRLYIEAGKMRRYAGMTDLDALKTITLNPAKMLGLDKFVGSIEEGKDADLAVFDGDPLSAMSRCDLTLIEGEIYFDREKDRFAGLKKNEAIKTPGRKK